MELSERQPAPQSLKPVIAPRTYADLMADGDFTISMGRMLELLAALSLREGRAWCSQRFLSDRMGRSRRWVQVLEDRLVEQGYLHVVHRPGRKSEYFVLKTTPAEAMPVLRVAQPSAPPQQSRRRFTSPPPSQRTLFEKKPQAWNVFAALSKGRDPESRDPGPCLTRAIRTRAVTLIVPHRRGSPRRIAGIDHWTNRSITLQLVIENSDEGTELFEFQSADWNQHWFGYE